MTEDDPRLARVPPAMRRLALQQLRGGTDPDVLVTEQVAITTRVSPSFTRIGHLDLFARRATAPNAPDKAKQQLRDMIAHAIFREYPHLLALAPQGLSSAGYLTDYTGCTD